MAGNFWGASLSGFSCNSFLADFLQRFKYPQFPNPICGHVGFRPTDYSWCGCEHWRSSGSVLHLQNVSRRTGHIRAGAEAFFIEEKREHAHQLCEQVYKKWLAVEIVVHQSAEGIFLKDFEFQIDWKKGRTRFGKREVILRERKPSYYAFQHLETGYPLVYNAIADLSAAGQHYVDLAAKSVPKIKDMLSKEVKQRMTLSETITNYLGDSYNLNLLCREMLEHFFKNEDMSFLSSILYAGPTKGYWEIGLGREILSPHN